MLQIAKTHNDFANILKEMIKISPLGYFATIKTKEFKKLYDEVIAFTPLLNDKKYSITTKCYWYINNITDFQNVNVVNIDLQIMLNLQLVIKNGVHQNVKIQIQTILKYVDNQDISTIMVNGTLMTILIK